MAVPNDQLRYAHSEGYMCLKYDESGKHIVTCGADGDLRVWKGMDDDDPLCNPVGTCFAVAMHKERVFVATSVNSVQILKSDDFSMDGIVAKFSAPATHIDFKKDGTSVAIGACDFTIKLVNIDTLDTLQFTGHKAPILSVALDPQNEYLASSSCDGSVKIWKLIDQTCCKTWKVVPKSNDFSASKTLCRVSWKPQDGQYLAVPVGKEIQLYERQTWEMAFVLKAEQLESMISIASFNHNGNYVAGTSVDGFILVWSILERKCVTRRWLDKKQAICSFEWNPSGNGEVAFGDTLGNMGVLENIVPEDDDQLMNEDELLAAYNDMVSDVESENENSFSISKIKAETVGLADDFDINDAKCSSTPYKPLSKTKDNMDDFMLEDDGPAIPTKHFNFSEEFRQYFGNSMQEAFQPGSTPDHLHHRFMMWNNVGMITCYNTDEENSIDVEFHDASVHHAIHITNTPNYTIGTVSTDAVLLAAESQDEKSSQLTCMHFGSWDNCKEWSVPMPADEEIQCVAIGQGWVAAATNQRNLRLFTISGVQKEIFSIPGVIVTISGFGEYLLVVYHSALGFPGEQSLAAMLLNVVSRTSMLSANASVPISPKSTLVWIGFSDEGTPCTFDSRGIIRSLSWQYKSCWYQVADTKSHAKGKSDNYFIIGLSENNEQIRCILCKGNRYPMTLPRPLVSILSLKLSLCEQNTEKGNLEENYWRQKGISDTLSEMEKQGFEIDSYAKEQSNKLQQENLMKMFALACQCDRDYRAFELCDMMASSHAVQLAIRYATRLNHIQLAERLGETARSKLEQETSKQAEEYQDESERHYRPVQRHRGFSQPDENVANGDVAYASDEESQVSINTNEDCEIEEHESPHKSSVRDDSVLPTTVVKNPFKVNQQSKVTSSSKGTELFDKLSGNKSKKQEKATFAPTATLKKGSKKKQLPNTGEETETDNKKIKPKENGRISGKSPFQSWVKGKKVEASNKADSTEDNEPNMEVDNHNQDSEIDNEKTSNQTEQKKRSHSDDDEQHSETKKPKTNKPKKSTTSKLTNFAYPRK